MFNIEWRDFTGGHFVGPVGTDQPKDTWRGEQACVSTADGMLMPAAVLEDVTPSGTKGWGVGDVRSPSQWGAPVMVTSSWHVVAGGPHQVVVWAYFQGSGTFDWVVAASNGAQTQEQVLAGTGAAYQFPTTRPAVWPSDSNAATVYIPTRVGPAFTTNRIRWYQLNLGASLAATTIGDAALPFGPGYCSVLEKWQEWLVAAQSGSNRLWWSDPGAPQTWQATSFIEVGDAAPITAIVPFANQLYIGKAKGWFVLSGVLGGGEVVRQLDVTNGPNGYFVAPVANGIMFDSPDLGISHVVQSGLRTPIVNHTKPDADDMGVHQVCPIADRLIAAGGGPLNSTSATVTYPTFSWIYDNGRWSKLTMPTFTDVEAWLWVKDCSHFRAVGDRYAWLWAKDSASGAETDSVARLYRWLPRLADPVPGTECTVELAEVRRSPAAPTGNSEFQVLDAWADVEIPPDATGIVGMDLSVRMVGVYDSDRGAAEATLQSQNKVAASFNGERTLVRWHFGLLTQTGSGVIPIVTLRGVKLRRLYMRCDDAGKL